MNISDLPIPTAWIVKDPKTGEPKLSAQAIQIMTSLRWAVLQLWASGTTAQRPANPVLGQDFWDTTLNQKVICTNPGVPTQGTPATWQALTLP